MMYISNHINENYFEVFDTDDVSKTTLSRQEILKLNKYQKVHGVFNDNIKIIDPFKLYKRWKLMGTLDKNLEEIGTARFFGYIYDNVIVSRSRNGLKLTRYLVSEEVKTEDNIVIPNDIVALDDYLFSSIYNLKSVKLPDTLKYLGEGCFSNCYELKDINLSNNILTLPNNCFKWCHKLDSITIPDSVLVIDGSCFYNCISLSNIKISNNIQGIGHYAFAYCKNLEYIFIPDSIQKIDSSAFYYCTNLKRVRLPKHMTNIVVNDVFSNCKSLEYVDFGVTLYNVKKDNWEIL